MALREIDENEYAELKRVADVAALIGKNPEARQRLQEAVAIAAPEQAGPEIRIRQEVTERLGGIEKKFDSVLDELKADREKREAEETERRLRDRWDSGNKMLRDAGYTEEGVKKIHDIMEQRGISDHEAAMLLYERENPQPEPVSTGGSRINIFGGMIDAGDDDNALKAFMDSGGTADEAFLQAVLPASKREVWGR